MADPAHDIEMQQNPAGNGGGGGDGGGGGGGGPPGGGGGGSPGGGGGGDGGGGMTDFQRRFVRAGYWTIGACFVFGVMGWTFHYIDIKWLQPPLAQPPMPPPSP